MLPLPLLPLLLLAALVPAGLCESAPRLVSEPATLVQYLAARGTTIHCAASGEPPPALSWIDDSGTGLSDVPALRRVHHNGTLEILGAPLAHVPPASSVRCRAANQHGVAISRQVTLQPVVDAAWQVVVETSVASVGGVAILWCRTTLPPQLVQITTWYRSGMLLHTDPPSSESRYVSASGALLIGGVSPDDAGSYSCAVRNALTGAERRAHPNTLTVAPWNGSSMLRVSGARLEVWAAPTQSVCLPCAPGYSTEPQYTWMREEPANRPTGEAGTWRWLRGAALCTRHAETAAGAWACRAVAPRGVVSAYITLHVPGALRVTITPGVLIAEAGGTARFSCNASDASAALSWLHDGAPVGEGAAVGSGELVIRGVSRTHRGVYQCLARAHADNAQAAAELRLRESAPSLHYTFIEQALRPGTHATLRCAAVAHPPPVFLWERDNQPLPRTHHSYTINTEAASGGGVLSVLNISAVDTSDGGLYTCNAQNSQGRARHSARLNVYGPVSMRAGGVARAVAGENATLHCPYAGYPISSVRWSRRGVAGGGVAGAGSGGRVSARGATLRLAPALPQDAGLYTCSVTPQHGAAQHSDVDLQVLNPPKISPFIFSSDLTEGSSAQVLCGVSSGDKPLYFSWLKDDSPLPPDLQIEEKSLGEFSLLMFSQLSARHSGAYTCRVANRATAVTYTATLSVKVPPAWITEPLDARVLLGAPLQLQCAARGHPTPKLTWYRRIDQAGKDSESETEQWEVIGERDQWRGARLGEGKGEAVLRATSGVLSAGAASRVHAGVYRCVADNGVGAPLHKHVNLTVHEAAHIDRAENVSVVRGSGATLECEARGDAPLHVQWTRSGAPPSHRWSVSETRNSWIVHSQLSVVAVEREDAGEFVCVVRNAHGHEQRALHLSVLEAPGAPRGVSLRGVSSRWVRVSWRVATHAVAYTAVYAPLHSTQQQTTTNLTLEHAADLGAGELSARVGGLRAGAAYSLRVAALNHVGLSPHSEPLLFVTLDEEPSAPPQNVRVTPAAEDQLHVSWSVPPEDTWNGELVGYVVAWRELTQFEDDEEEEDEEDEVGNARAGRVTSLGGARTELTLVGLRAARRYEVGVRAVGRAGAGPASRPTLTATAPGAPTRAPPRVVCDANEPRALRVRWVPLSAYHMSDLRGYDLHYAPANFDFTQSLDEADEVTWEDWAGVVRVGVAGEATLRTLRAATNYSVWVRARSAAGPGPPSQPAYCVTAADAAGAVRRISAVSSGARSVRVTWLPPAGAPPSHYTLHARDKHKVGGEWLQRVEVTDDGAEVRREVGGLRERALYEMWVRAASTTGLGAPSPRVAAAPAPLGAARVTSLSRTLVVAAGARVRLPCGAVGAPPLRRFWNPAHAEHTLNDQGDLVIDRALARCENYTCSVQNALGADAVRLRLCALVPPPVPRLRLERAAPHALRVSWNTPASSSPLRAYTLRWARGEETPQTRRLPPTDTVHELRGLTCGAVYSVALRAHGDAGASPYSEPLLLSTTGDKARAPSGKMSIWANSTTLRVNLLTWEESCPVMSWSVAVRDVTGGNWREINTNGELAEAGGLRTGTWHEVRVQARTAPGITAALYRAATLTHRGERLGDVQDVREEAPQEGASPITPRAPLLAPALLVSALALLLAALTGVMLAQRRKARRAGPAPPHSPQHIYSSEPRHTNEKILTPPDVTNSACEISPYATFSVSGRSAEEGACALQLRTWGRAEPRGLAAPPPRPNLLAHTEYGRTHDSDSESSGSPCAACAAHLSDTLPAGESSAESASYGAGARSRRRDRPSLRYQAREPQS